ncbi:MAG TPA: putative toxin-antitoxin system toxin component, PIN family [Bacteroidales bacterium]|nr:putative toxin-antitoxin system toxin component, PIN family [Bacteroidales bacterium]
MPKNKPLRLVIDTNLWISFIISKKLNQLEPILLIENTRIIFSSELVQELEATITKPKLQKYFSENALDEMLNVFDPYIDFIIVKSKVQVCRDPKDDFLLSLAKDGKANYLLTGDNDLLEIGKFGETEIIKITDFIKKNSR